MFEVTYCAAAHSLFLLRTIVKGVTLDGRRFYLSLFFVSFSPLIELGLRQGGCLGISLLRILEGPLFFPLKEYSHVRTESFFFPPVRPTRSRALLEYLLFVEESITASSFSYDSVISIRRNAVHPPPPLEP